MHSPNHTRFKLFSAALAAAMQDRGVNKTQLSSGAMS
jgi:hypothetical protein